ncbi:MAG: hypothetical protein ACK45X_05885 [Roseiflexaceae bacterium]|jgi:hypothetical protein|nr:hypothetical protein [Chloroflexaceae bacterium]
MTMMIHADERIVAAVHLFNTAQWRDALLQFESVWVETRDVELKILIQLANVMLQLHMGYVISPRKLIARACELLGNATGSTGIDLVALHESLLLLATYVPAEDTDLLDVRTLPRIVLRWHDGSS